MDENEVEDAIRTILRDDKNYEKSLNYVINYYCAALKQKMAGGNSKSTMFVYPEQYPILER